MFDFFPFHWNKKKNCYSIAEFHGKECFRNKWEKKWKSEIIIQFACSIGVHAQTLFMLIILINCWLIWIIFFIVLFFMEIPFFFFVVLLSARFKATKLSVSLLHWVSQFQRQGKNPLNNAFKAMNYIKIQLKILRTWINYGKKWKTIELKTMTKNWIVFLIRKKKLVFRKNRISIHQRISISLHIHRIFLRLLDTYVQIPPREKTHSS